MSKQAGAPCNPDRHLKRLAAPRELLALAAGLAVALLLAMPLALPQKARADILWMGGEPVDFSTATASTFNTTNTAYFRTGYARGAIAATTASTIITSNPFPTGPLTSAWLSARVYVSATSTRGIGLVNSSNGSGIWVGWLNTAPYTVAIYKGTTTSLVTASVGQLPNATLTKIDVEIKNFGSNPGTVNVYLNGSSSPTVSYRGDLTVTGTTTLNAVGVGNWGGAAYVSEILVGDMGTDTRGASVVTLAPSANGDTTTDWTGSCSPNLNETAITDSTTVTTATGDRDFQCALGDTPAGSFSVEGVFFNARVTKTSSGISLLSLGVKTNGSISVPLPITPPTSTTWGYTNTVYQLNPITGGFWTKAELDALQVDLRSLGTAPTQGVPTMFIISRNEIRERLYPELAARRWVSP